MTINNKILLYKSILIWTYRIKPRAIDPSYHNNLKMAIKSFERTSEYTLVFTLLTDVGIKFVQGVIQEKSSKHHAVETYENPLLEPLLVRDNNRKLKRLRPIDLK